MLCAEKTPCTAGSGRCVSVVELQPSDQPRHGEPSHYRRRRPVDSQMDTEKSLADQFNLLRVVVYQDYPAFSG